jgi:sulfate adenylyltransferase
MTAQPLRFRSPDEDPIVATLAPLLAAAHGGDLVDLVVDAPRAAELKAASLLWPSWTLDARQLCDLELLLNGGFSPLRGFMTSDELALVSATMRLADGTLWPMPVTLDVDAATAQSLAPGDRLALRDAEGVMLAALHVSEVYELPAQQVAAVVFGTLDRHHPGVEWMLHEARRFAVAGRVEGLQLPEAHDFRALRPTPRQLRARFAARGWRRVIAFQTRNPMHRAHFELTRRAAEEVGAGLLLHPAVGPTRPGDVDPYTRVRCYQAILGHYPPHSVELALLPLAMRMGGPREALWHAIIRKNYGCTHFIVGRDHAGPGNDASGRPFYPPYAAQELVVEHQQELGVTAVPFREMVYVEQRAAFVQEQEVAPGEHPSTLSGTELRRHLAQGLPLPGWFTFPEVAAELRRTHPPRSRQGFTVFFTGLSGAGKSTVAGVLLVKLLALGGRAVTLLDGDVVRRHLSSELGFSKEHRDLNIRRIGFVAGEITRSGGIALCAPIAPYESVRNEVRHMIEPGGGFVLVHVATPLAVCEQRDRKGLYAKARAGILREFTGISDPYEVPVAAEVVIDTSRLSPAEAAQRVLEHLQAAGYLAADPA